MVDLNKYGEIEGGNCSNCGQAIKPKWVACPDCGNPLKKGKAINTKKDRVVRQDAGPISSFWNRIEVLTVFILFVIISILGFMYFNELKDKLLHHSNERPWFLIPLTFPFLISIMIGIAKYGSDLPDYPKFFCLIVVLAAGVGLLCWYKTPYFLFLLPFFSLLLFMPER